MFVLDKLLPHLHPGSKNPEGMTSSLRRTTMLVFAVTLHNIPEGMAVGLSFGLAAVEQSPAGLAAAFSLAIGMGLQNFPEGAAISLPLQKEGCSKLKSFIYGSLSGIVEPMSEAALVQSINVEMKQHFSQGEEYLLVTPGNYGADYLREHMDLPYEKNIKCSNYVGETIDMAIDMGVKGILFIAHIGKFVKVAAGIMNTHSHSADARMEVLASNAIRAGASLECAKEILNASTTDEAIDILEKYQILQKTMKEILDRIQFYLNHRSYEQILLGAVIFNNTYGYLGQTADAEKLIKLINAQNDEAQ